MRELLSEVENGKEIYEEGDELYTEADDSKYQNEYTYDINGKKIEASTKEEFNKKLNLIIEDQVAEGKLSSTDASDKVQKFEEK